MPAARSRSLRFDAAAERELNEAVDFYDLESPGLGDVFLAEVEHALTQVEAFPEAAQPLCDGVRRPSHRMMTGKTGKDLVVRSRLTYDCSDVVRQEVFQ